MYCTGWYGVVSSQHPIHPRRRVAPGPGLALSYITWRNSVLALARERATQTPARPQASARPLRISSITPYVEKPLERKLSSCLPFESPF
jgi:hypothetical protein